MIDFDSWFARLAGGDATPHAWQRALADDSAPRSRLIRIPTGMGKTLGVLAAWSWHRIHRGDDTWPRRLVWTLPMRVLAEQTEAVIREALDRLGIAWDGSTSHQGKTGVHLLMGGADPGGDWQLYPEEFAVLIGTQDMLFSRALNRGYAAGRARWPLEFGLLSHDALWVMDEVQLMDVALATSAQIQAYHDQDAGKGFRPRHSWWVSATLQPGWLRSVDTDDRYADWAREPLAVTPEARDACPGARGKLLSRAVVPASDPEAFAQAVFDGHASTPDEGFGRITLVVCNTVRRSCETYDALRLLAPAQEIELVHSRYRPAERLDWRPRFLSREACSPGANRVIVATQVVEAGVDISAGCVITELAPWPSLVQRFGRCARYGGRGCCVVVDRGGDDVAALPYSPSELDASRATLGRIEASGGDVGVAPLEAFEASLDESGRKDLYPYDPAHLLLRREFDELFDTTPDLTGADLDISRFIRSGDERDLRVFWRDIPEPPGTGPPPVPLSRSRPQQNELCPVPFLLARDWLFGAEKQSTGRPRLRPRMRAWVWDWSDGAWVVAERSMLTPGRVVLVASDAGGYRRDRGFDPTSREAVPIVALSALSREAEAAAQADESDGADDLSSGSWKTIACHGHEAAEVAARLASAVGLPDDIAHLLELSSRWHDLGKAHPAFQGSIRAIGSSHRPDRQDLAKAPSEAFPKRPGDYRDGQDRRPGLRHELASALALFSVLERHEPMHPALLGPWGEALRLMNKSAPSERDGATPTPCEREVLDCSAEGFDLLAYLVASHHGKVRVALHASPKDQDYRDPGDGNGLPVRGVREGDILPAVSLDPASGPIPAITLCLDPATLGLSTRTGRSWRERTLDLIDRFGPGALAWLEALLIAADRHASRLKTPDPALQSSTPEG